jgi:hypothetical protein
MNLMNVEITQFEFFHGYEIYSDGKVLGKSGEPLKLNYRERRGGKLDARVSLSINGKTRKFTLQRLIEATFGGCLYGYEVNHKDRDTLNNCFTNTEPVTASENQKHWRACELTL